MKPTPSELQLLRTRPHQTRLWLSIYRPQTVMACQVTNIEILHPVARGVRLIDYINVTYGNYSAIESGMTMYVGTTPGAWDVGRVRVVSANSTFFTVAENDDINWQGLQYLTVVRYWEIWPVYPRLVQDEEDVTFYKDYDIVYSNQNSDLGSFINMGPHHVAFVDPSTDEGAIYYSASGTYNLLGRSLTYDWAFEGGDPTGSSLHTPGWIHYPNTGHYTTRLRVADPSGTSDVSYRHVSIYDYPDHGSFNSVLEWNLESLSGSREEGGYSARIWVRGTVDYLVDGMLVVIRSDDWWGNTKTILGGNALNRGETFFVGYIVAGSIRRNYRDAVTEFEIRSPTGIMASMESFSVSVESKLAPQYWYELVDMDVRRALYHYLRWHSTVLMCNDFEFVGTDQRIQYFDADRTSLYDAIETLMRGTLIGDVICDRQGKIWAEVDISATPTGTSAFQTSLEMSNMDWMGEPSIDERTINDVSYLELGGIYYGGPQPDPDDDVSLPFLSAAPGETPSYRGSVEREQGLGLASQDQLNAMTGNVFAFRNARYPDSTYEMSGNYRNFDIAPQELINISLAAVDTPRGIVFDQKPFALRGMEWRYDSHLGLMLPTIHVVEVTAGLVGMTIPVPEPPKGGNDQPPTPPPPPLPPPIGGGGAELTFIPATGGYQWNATKYITAIPYGTVELIKTDRTDACGSYRAVSAGTFILTPILYSETSGNGAMYAENEVLVSRVGGLVFAVDDVLESDAAMQISGYTLVQGPSCTVTAAAGDIITCRFQRNGPDNYGSDVYILGWIIT